jgi:DNA-binding transcriptional MerR regulator
VGEPGEPAPVRPVKSPSAFRTIGEVAEDLALPAHVLRFWEAKFPQLRPLKRGGGRRYYRPEDIVLLRRIRQCLYQDGYTIRGVQKLLGGAEAAPAAAAAAEPSLFPLAATPDPAAPAAPPAPRRPRRRPAKPAARNEDPAALEEIRRQLREARALLDRLLRRPQG